MAAHGVHGLRHLAQAVAMVEQRQHAGLVRDGEPEAVDVASAQHVANEALQADRGHLRRHQHRIHPMAHEQRVEQLRRAHLGHGVSEDHEDARAAGDVHGGG
jgi:hypothetical protein